MKTLKAVFAGVVLLLCFAATPAQAQFRVGPKVGVGISKLHLSDPVTNLDPANRAGFTAGLMAEFTVPIIGIGVDVSALYVRRSAEYNDKSINKREYIDVPLNLKWKMNIPVINNIIRPFLTTGPAFSFLTSKRGYQSFRNKECDVAWNFGLGAELVRHLQIAASYGLGIKKAVEIDNRIDAKNRCWTITAAYLF